MKGAQTARVCVCVGFFPPPDTIDVVAIISETIKLIIQQRVFIVHGSKVCVSSSCPNIYEN